VNIGLKLFEEGQQNKDTGPSLFSRVTCSNISVFIGILELQLAWQHVWPLQTDRQTDTYYEIFQHSSTNSTAQVTLYIHTETHFRATAMRCANGFSQAYILITWIPTMISFMNLMRSSVLLAVRMRNVDIIFPNPAKMSQMLVQYSIKVQCSYCELQDCDTVL
jgi:hypothetical protein